jgi:hypothetical protein
MFTYKILQHCVVFAVILGQLYTNVKCIKSLKESKKGTTARKLNCIWNRNMGKTSNYKERLDHVVFRLQKRGIYYFTAFVAG